jgi:Glyoxalase-like domain
MTASLDHLVYVSPDLGPAVADIAAQTGVRPAFGGQHPGLGTHNALLSLASRTYLEIIAPDPAQPRPADPLPFGLGTVTQPGLRAWAVAPDDLDAAVRRAASAGFDYAAIVNRRRRTADGRELTWRMTVFPQSPGVAVTPFLIDWHGGEHPADAAPAGLGLHQFRVCSPEPDRLAALLGALGLDLNVESASRPALSAELRGPQDQRLVLGP